MPGPTVNLNAEQRRALGHTALAWCLQYFDAVTSLRVYPATTADELNDALREPLPDNPQPLGDLMAQFARIVEGSRHNGHPRMWGYVQSSGSFAGAIADLLISTLNANVTSWRSAPAATTIELQTIAWIAAMVGYPADAGGLFLSGGSLANFAGLATALRNATDMDIAARGVTALGQPAAIYATAMTHMSVAKAAALLGLGRDAVRIVPHTGAFEMDASALDAQLARDRANGALPIAVVATAGDVNTGAIDAMDALADVCGRHKVWLHVDGAYGGFAALAPSVRARFSGLSRADSVALDPHKWLFAPLDAGCLLVRDRGALRRAFRHGASYVDVIAHETMSDFAFWDHGPELSRRFRALKVWFALKLHGVDAFTATIEANLAVARRLAELIDASDDFERLAAAPLSIVCFRHVAADVRDRLRVGDDEALRVTNTRNRDLMLAMQRDGDAYLSNADINGAFALRACIVNFRATRADADRILETLRRLAREAL